MDIFINKSITNGIEAYNNKNAGKDYSSSHYYELTIIEILTKIYDRVSIIIPYKTKYEKNFINNLKIYGLSNEDTNLFITSLEEYDNWLTNQTGTTTKSVDNIHLKAVGFFKLRQTCDDFLIFRLCLFCDGFCRICIAAEYSRQLFTERSGKQRPHSHWHSFVFHFAILRFSSESDRSGYFIKS